MNPLVLSYHYHNSGKIQTQSPSFSCKLLKPTVKAMLAKCSKVVNVGHQEIMDMCLLVLFVFACISNG